MDCFGYSPGCGLAFYLQVLVPEDCTEADGVPVWLYFVHALGPVFEWSMNPTGGLVGSPSHMRHVLQVNRELGS